MRKLILPALAALVLAAPAAADPIALVFNDDNTPSGCDDGCAAAAARALIASPGHFLVKYVGPKGEPFGSLQSAVIGGDEVGPGSCARGQGSADCTIVAHHAVDGVGA